MESAAEGVLAARWEYDPGSGRHVFRGAAAALGAARAVCGGAGQRRGRLRELFELLGLRLPPEIPDCGLDPCPAPAAAESGEDSSDDERRDPCMEGQMGQLQIQEPREPTDDLDRLGFTRPLPPLAATVAAWRRFLTQRSEITAELAEAALADAEEFAALRTEAVLAACEDAGSVALAPAEDPRAAVFSGFLYSYSFAAPVFWAVWRRGRWRVHRRSALLEQLHQQWLGGGPPGHAVGPEWIDLAAGTAQRPGGETVPLRRIEGQLPEADPHTQLDHPEGEAADVSSGVLLPHHCHDLSAAPPEPICRFRQTVWWAAGSDRPLSLARDGAGDWAPCRRPAGDSGWEDAPGQSAHALEHIWSAPPRRWQPTPDVRAWLAGERPPAPRLGGGAARPGGGGGGSTRGGWFSSRLPGRAVGLEDSGRLAESQSGAGQPPRRSVSKRSGSILVKMQDECPPSPGPVRGLGFDAAGGVSWSAPQDELPAQSAAGRRASTRGRAGAPAGAGGGVQEQVPPLVLLLRMRFGAEDSTVRAVIDTLEIVPWFHEATGEDAAPPAAPGVVSLASFQHGALICCESRRMTLHSLARLDRPLGVAVSNLLSDHPNAPGAAECAALVHRAAGALLPPAERSGLKQLREEEVTTDTMGTLRRGQVLVNRGLLLLRPTLHCEVMPRSVNLEFLGQARDLSLVSRHRRLLGSVLPPCVLEVVTDLTVPSRHPSTPAGAGPPCAGVTLRQVEGRDVVKARLRQIVSDCEDTRLAAALGEIINGRAHVQLNYTDPATAGRVVKIDKQPQEALGISMMVALKRRLDPDKLAGAPQSPSALLSKASSKALMALGQKHPGRSERGRPQLFGVDIAKLQEPHSNHVLVSDVGHASPAERFGILSGWFVEKVGGEQVRSVTHTQRLLAAASRGQREVSVSVATPTLASFGVWELKERDGWTTLRESAAVEEAYQRYVAGGASPARRFFAVDSPWDGNVVVNPPGGQHFGQKRIPHETATELDLELPQRGMQWLKGELPPNSLGAVVGSFKVAQPLKAARAAGGGRSAASGDHSPGSPDSGTAPQQDGGARELNETELAFVRECESNMKYPPAEVTEAIAGFQDAASAELPKRRKAAALLIEAFLWACLPGVGGARRLGHSAALQCTHWFARWYALSGNRKPRGYLYYCVSLAASSKLCVVHHSAVRPKDVRLYDLKEMTRKLLIDGDHMRWMQDQIRRVERTVPAAVGDDGMELVARACELRPPGVTHLSLDGNGLTDDCVPHLVSILIHNSAIRGVSLEYNPLMRPVHKSALACLMRCNELDCEVDHEDLDHMELLRYVCRRREELLPPGDLRTVCSKNALAMLSQKAAHFDEAEILFKDAWQLAAVRQAATRSMEATQAVATILYNLGTLYLLRGDLESGRDVFLKSFEGVMSVAGPNHPSVWRMIVKYADFYTEQREYNKALYWYQFAGRELHRSLGPRSDLIAEADYRAATAHMAGGNSRMGLYALLAALHTFRIQLGPRDEQVFLCVHNVASCLHRMFCPELGLRLHDQALHNLTEAHADRRVRLSQVAHSVLMVATFYRELAESEPAGPYTEQFLGRALELFEEAQCHYSQLVQGWHPDFIALLLQKVATMVALGRLRDAQPLLEQVLENARELQGEEHPLNAEAARWLARLLVRAGQSAEAVPVLERARDALADGGGADRSPTMATVLFDLGVLCASQRLYGEGEAALLRALSIRTTLYGPDHPAVTLCFSALGDLYKRWGMYDEAEDYAKRHLTHRLLAYPESKAWLLCAMEQLAEIRHSQGKVYEAQVLREARRLADDRAVYTAYGAAFKRGVGELRKVLKDTDSVYQMKEISWEARMQYIAARANRSFPLDLVRHLPAYNPFNRAPGVPLSTVEQAFKLQAMPGLTELVRFFRVLRPAEQWRGLRQLETALMTRTSRPGEAEARLRLQGAPELHPTMFGVEEEEPVWAPSSDAADPALDAALDTFLLSEEVAPSEQPLFASLSFVSEHLTELRRRQQRKLAEELGTATSRGLLTVYWRRLRGWMDFAAAVRECRVKDPRRRASDPDAAPAAVEGTLRQGALRPRDLAQRRT